MCVRKVVNLNHAVRLHRPPIHAIVWGGHTNIGFLAGLLIERSKRNTNRLVPFPLRVTLQMESDFFPVWLEL
jgi:hypothetical protein